MTKSFRFSPQAKIGTMGSGALSKRSKSPSTPRNHRHQPKFVSLVLASLLASPTAFAHHGPQGPTVTPAPGRPSTDQTTPQTGSTDCARAAVQPAAIGALIANRCNTCHRTGGAAENWGNFTRWENVTQGHPRMLREIHRGRMPEGATIRPTAQCGGPDLFSSPRLLADDEVQALRDWQTCGSHGGDNALLTPPAQPQRNADGFIGTAPDAVLSNVDQRDGEAYRNGFPIPPVQAGTPVGVDTFRNFILPMTGVTGRTLTGLQFVVPNENPDAAGGTPFPITHHVHLFLANDCACVQRSQTAFQNRLAAGGATVDDEGEPFTGPGWNERVLGCENTLMGSWFPGSGPISFGPGVGVNIPQGSCFVMQMHYTHYNENRTVLDQTKVGLNFAPQGTPVRHQRYIVGIQNTTFTIPAGSRDHQVSTTQRIASDSTLWAIVPHSHQLSTQHDLQAILPDGAREQCLANVRWDFEHQTTHTYRRPICVPAGTQLRHTCHFDNSAANPRQFNRPPIDVPFGPLANREMCRMDYAMTSGYAEGCIPLANINAGSGGQ